MISVQSVNDVTLARLDAEGSDRYLFDQDIKPGINSAISWLVIVFNAAFAQKKLSEENLQDLTKLKVWQANNFSRVDFDESLVGQKLWTVLGVFPTPTTTPAAGTLPALPDPVKAVFRDDLTFVSSDFACDRLTLEQWNQNRDNVFLAGNTRVTNKLLSHAYLGFVDYSSTSYSTVKEIEIRPDISSQLVAISYLKIPEEITDISDNIEFPGTLLELVVEKTLNKISYKQGDGTNLYAVTERDIARLVQLMS